MKGGDGRECPYCQVERPYGEDGRKRCVHAKDREVMLLWIISTFYSIKLIEYGAPQEQERWKYTVGLVWGDIQSGVPGRI